MTKYRFAAPLLMLALVCFTACDNNNQQTKTQSAANEDVAEAANTKPAKTVLFFGDSLTAGHGLDDPATDSYPSVVQQKINDAKLPYNVVNAGNSGETTAGGRARIDWVLKQKIDVFVLELGANDGLRGTPISETTRNLQFIIDKVKAKYPDAKLVMAGMQIPPSMGADYANRFKEIFPKLAQKNNMTLIPFLLDRVGGVAKLNQGDGIHPNPEGAKILADNVWMVLEKVL